MDLSRPLLRRFSVALRFVLGAAIIGATVQATRAATFTWTATTSGSWSTAGNWDVQPIFPGSGTDVIQFGTGGTYTSNLDAAFGSGAYSLNQLNFANPSGTVSVSADDGNSFTLAGTAPGINLTGAGNAFVSAPISLGAAATFRNSGTGTLTVSGGISFGANTLTVDGGGNTTLLGNVGNAGAGGLTKLGPGTLSITGAAGAATYTGTTTVSGGTVALSYANVATNLINSGSALTLGGAGGGTVPGGSGTLSLTSGAAASAQTFGGAAFTVASGAGTVALSNAGGGGMTLTLPGTWTRPTPTATVGGGTVNFVVPAGTSISSSPALSNGIIGGWATIGAGASPTDWATVSGGLIAPLGTYTNDTWATANNTTVTVSATQAGTVTNSVRFNNTAALTVTHSAAHTVNQGILVTANVGPNLSTMTGSTLRSTTANADLIINQYNPHVAGLNAGVAGSGDLVIGSQLIVNGTGGLTISGNGYVVLTSTSATTLANGAWTINKGASLVGVGANNISFGAATLTWPIVLNGGAIGVQPTGGANNQISATHAVIVNQDSTIFEDPGASGSSNLLVGANAANTAAGVEIQLNNNSTITFDEQSSVNNIRVNKRIINGPNSVGSVNIIHGLVLLNPTAAAAGGTPNTFTGPVRVFNNGILGATTALASFTWADGVPGQIILGDATTNSKGQFNLSGYAFTINGNANLQAVGTGVNTINANAASVLTFNPTGGNYTFSGSLTGGANMTVVTNASPGNNLVLNMVDVTANIGSLSSNITAPGTVTINLINNAGTTFTVNTAATDTFGGVFASPTGTGNLTINGAGSLKLTNNNTYNGFTHVDNGTLVVGANNALPVTTSLRIGNQTAVTTSLDLNGFNQSVAGLSANPSATLASVVNVFNNSGAGTSTLTITGGTNVFGGAVAPASANLKDNNGAAGGVVAVAVTGGTTTFAGAAASNVFSYSGGTTVGGTGTLNIDDDAKLGTGGLTLNAGGTLQFAAAGGVTLAATRPVTLAGGAFDTNGGNNTIASNLTGTSLTKTGGGTLSLTGANTYTGLTTVQNGTLRLGSAGAMPVGGAGLLMGSGSNNSTFDLNGQNATVASLSSTGTGTATILNSAAAASTLTFAGGTSTFAGVLSDGGASPVNLAVNSGSLTLTNANNTITAAQVNGGTLTVRKGGLGATATVAVLDTGTFGVTVATPGDVLTIGTFTVGSGAGTSNLTFNLNGNPTAAPISATNVAGSPGGTSLVNITNGSPALTSPASFTLLTSANPIANAGAFALGQLPPRVVANLVTNATSLQLNITAIDTIKWKGQNGTNPTFWDINTTANWVLTSTGTTTTTYLQPTVPGDTVTFDGTATGPKTIDLRTALSPAAVTVDTAGGDYTFTSTVSGSLTGTMGLVKKSAGTLFVANATANTYAGGTTIQGGTVQIGGTTTATPGTGSLPVASAGASVTLSTGGKLAFNLNAPFAFAGNIVDTDGTGVVNVLANTVTLTGPGNTWAGGTTINPSATLQVGDGTTTGSLAGDVTNNGTLAFRPAGGGVVFAGNVAGTGGGVQSLGTQSTTLGGNVTGSQSLQVNETSTAILTGAANTYTGGTTVNTGATLQVGNGTLSGSLPGNATVNGTLAFNPGSGGVAYGGNVSGTGLVQTTGAGAGDVTLGGVLSGGLALTAGRTTGITVVTGANTYTGLTSVSAGATLQVGNGVVSGTLPGTTTIAATGTLSFRPAPAGATYGNAINGGGAAVLVAPATVTFANAMTYAGGTTVPAGATLDYGVANALPNAGTLTVDGTVNLNGLNANIFGLAGAGTINLGSVAGSVLTVNGSGTFNGVITGAGNLSKATNNTTQLTLSNHNTYAGSTNVQNSDTVNIGIDNAIPIGTLLQSLGTTGANQIFDLKGFNQRVATVSSTITTGSFFIQNSGPNPSTLTISNGSTNMGAALTTGTAGLRETGGTLALTVVGGTQTLAGVCTYNGDTTILNGQITANFNTANTAPTTVVPTTSRLVMGGGTFQVSAKNTVGVISTQTVNGLLLTPGNSAFNYANVTNGAVVLNLGAITRSPGTRLDFGTLPTSTGSADTTTTANALFAGGQQTILGGYATVANSTWAVSGTGATAGAISGLATFDASPNFTAAGDQDAVPDVVISPTASMTINSLRFNTAATTGYTYTPTTAGDTLTVATGGILVTTTVGTAHPIGFDAGGVGNLTSGNGQDLIVNHRNGGAAEAFTVGSKITGAIGLTKTGGGTLILTNPANDYTGATYILGGTVSANKLSDGGVVSSIGNSSNAAANLYIANGNLTYTGSGDTTDRLFTFGNSGVVTVSASGTGALTFSNTGNLAFASTSTLTNNAVAASLTLGGTSPAANTFAPKITDVATIVTTNITTIVTKSGAGTWVLTNANTYSGTTTVNAGTLMAGNTTGSATGSGPVTVNSTGTLGGTGRVDGVVTLNAGGSVAPGASIGTIRVGNAVTTASPAMVWQGGSGYAFEHKTDPTAFTGPGGAPSPGTDNDLVTTASTTGVLDLTNLNVANPFVFTLVPTGNNNPPGQLVTYALASFPTITGFNPATDQNKFAFAGLWDQATTATLLGNAGTPLVGLAGTSGSGQVLTLQFAPVPEPAFVLLACGAVAGGFASRKRRRK